jgi:molecular chaperone GrpE (heat shock protein)
LTPAAIEAVLADFRAWLQHLSSAVPAGHSAEEQAEAIDLHSLLGQFVALRHDVNLQTKAARSQQEQAGQALQQLSQALEAAHQAEAAAQQSNQRAQDEALRPLLKTLLDVHDAFSLAEREIRRARETILPLLDELALESLPSENGPPDSEPEPVGKQVLHLEPELGGEAETEAESAPPRPKVSVWQKWFGRHRSPGGGGPCDVQPATLAKLQAQQQRLLAKFEEQRQALVAQHDQYQRLLNRQQERQRQELASQRERQEKIEGAAERLDQLIDSVVTGYRMSLQRLERALRHSGLEPIPCVGETFDPEKMEVVAAVADSGHPPGEVIEEVRRGYLWQGRVFRYAQVSVAKS